MREDEKSELHDKEMDIWEIHPFLLSGQTVICSSIFISRTKNLQNVGNCTFGCCIHLLKNN